MISKACCFVDVYYIKKLRYYCFNYKSIKRHKIKVIKFIKNNNDINIIKEYLKNYNLDIKLISKSRRYKFYDVIDL